MKEIQLTHGRIALVDDILFAEFSKLKWSFHQGYAKRNFPKKTGGRVLMGMHRFIMNAQKGQEVDHIDGNRLNNQRSNLRICSHSQNQMNRAMAANNTSGFKGVVWDKNVNKWRSEIKINKIKKCSGYFVDKKDAAVAYNNAARKYFGEFARLNII